MLPKYRQHILIAQKNFSAKIDALLIKNGMDAEFKNEFKRLRVIIQNFELSTKKNLAKEIAKLATKEEIAKLATKEELAKLATKEEIAKLATKEELAKLATKDEIDDRFMDLTKHFYLREEIDEKFAQMYTKDDHAKFMIYVDEAFTEIKEFRRNRLLSENQLVELDDQVANHEKRIRTLEKTTTP